MLGLDPATEGAAIRARLGVVPQEDSLDMELTVEENLVIYGRYFDLSYSEAREPRDGSCWTSSSSRSEPRTRSSRCPAA